VSNNKWANGTVLHYYFFKNLSTWRASTAQKKVLRDAFQKWKSVGIGLKFKEVDNPGEAEIRIAFERNSGHWSYLGRDI
jgi:hypothetical protein